MSQMSKHYEPEFKKKIVRLHLEEGRTLKGLAAEYGVSKEVSLPQRNSRNTVSQLVSRKA